MTLAEKLAEIVREYGEEFAAAWLAAVPAYVAVQKCQLGLCKNVRDLETRMKTFAFRGSSSRPLADEEMNRHTEAGRKRAQYELEGLRGQAQAAWHEAQIPLGQLLMEQHRRQEREGGQSAS